jgi:hypothetical protein
VLEIKIKTQVQHIFALGRSEINVIYAEKFFYVTLLKLFLA